MIFSNFIFRELAKYKKSPLIFVILVFPIFAGIIASISLFEIYKNTQFEKIWPILLVGNKIQSIWIIVSISLITLITSLIVLIDKDNKTYKVIFSSTISKKIYYIEKLFTVGLFIFIFIVSYNISIVIVSKFLFINLNIDYWYICNLILNEYIMSISIGAIQLYFAIYMRNIIESIFIGVCGSIVGLGIISQFPKLAIVFPYSYPYFVLLKNQINITNINIIFLSLLYLIIFSILGIKKLEKVDVSEVE